MHDLLTFFDKEILVDLQRDVQLLEYAEQHGERGRGAQLLIDKHRIMANILDEYRNRAMSAQGLLVEWRNKIIALREAAND